MVKKLFLCFCALFTFFCSYSISGGFTFYSDGNYGLELLDVNEFKDEASFRVLWSQFDNDGNFYFVSKCEEYFYLDLDGKKVKASYALCKMNSNGKIVWIKAVEGGGGSFYFFDDALLYVIHDYFENSDAKFGDNFYKSNGERSVFLLKIDKENGEVLNFLELEADNFVEYGFKPFSEYTRKAFAVSPEGDLWFMYDINEKYSGVNKDYPVNFDRHGGNDKCLFVLNKNLEIKKLFCLGSKGNDETFYFVDEEYLIPYMTFVQDTLYMYIPFKGKECNVSLDPENPVVVENASFLGKASVAFCKYLVKGDKIELLAYKVSMSSDGQFKGFAVNSDNKLIGMRRKALWDEGDEYYYEILPDFTFKKLEGYAYFPMSYPDDSFFWFDSNDDIIRRCSWVRNDNTFTENISFPEVDLTGGLRAAKYDGKTLQNKWVMNQECETFWYMSFAENANKGLVYITNTNNPMDVDPSDKVEVYGSTKFGSVVLARYIETYRVKTLSDSVSIVVNGGKDMVRHGEDAEIVVTADNGYNIKSITTSRGDILSLSDDGKCIIKNVREPIELFFNAGQGDNSVEQTDAVALGVYPNPVKDVLYVKDADSSSFLITDFDGKTVCEGVVSDGKINVSHISKGVYVLTLKKGVGSFSTKLIKE